MSEIQLDADLAREIVMGTGADSANVREFAWSAHKERAAEMLAIDEQSDEAIARTVGVVPRSLWRWKAHPDFRARVSEIRVATLAAIRARGIADSLAGRWKTMSTIGLENWAVDLKTVGAIYPFQGWEVAMTIAAVAFWVVWHIWQISFESRELSKMSKGLDAAKAKAAIDRY